MSKSPLSKSKNTATSAAAYVDPFAVPVAPVSDVHADLSTAVESKRGGPAPMLPMSAVNEAHAKATALGETRILFGVNADGTACTAVLRTVNAVAGNGTVSPLPILAVAHAVTNAGMGARFRVKGSGAPVALGAVIGAPMGETGHATACPWAYVIGYDVTLPVALSLTSRKGQYVTPRKQVIELRSGRELSLVVAVRCAVQGETDEWTVNGKIHSGGEIEETAPESLALGGLNAAKGDVNAAIAILQGSLGTQATASAVKRATTRQAVAAAKRRGANAGK